MMAAGSAGKTQREVLDALAFTNDQNQLMMKNMHSNRAIQNSCINIQLNENLVDYSESKFSKT